jgi:hypothetical protein
MNGSAFSTTKHGIVSHEPKHSPSVSRYRCVCLIITCSLECLPLAARMQSKASESQRAEYMTLLQRRLHAWERLQQRSDDFLVQRTAMLQAALEESGNDPEKARALAKSRIAGETEYQARQRQLVRGDGGSKDAEGAATAGVAEQEEEEDAEAAAAAAAGMRERATHQHHQHQLHHQSQHPRMSHASRLSAGSTQDPRGERLGRDSADPRLLQSFVHDIRNGTHRHSLPAVCFSS